jgi:hypothetical protein
MEWHAKNQNQRTKTSNAYHKLILTITKNIVENFAVVE